METQELVEKVGSDLHTAFTWQKELQAKIYSELLPRIEANILEMLKKRASEFKDTKSEIAGPKTETFKYIYIAKCGRVLLSENPFQLWFGRKFESGLFPEIAVPFSSLENPRKWEIFMDPWFLHAVSGIFPEIVSE